MMMFRKMGIKKIYLVRYSSFKVDKFDRKSRKEVMDFMTEVFFKHEPSSVFTGVSQKAVLSFPLIELSTDLLEKGHSFLARTNDFDKRLVGVAINGSRPCCLGSNYLDDTMEQLVCDKEKRLLKLWRKLACEPTNAGELFPEVKKVLNTNFIAVHPKSQNNGIGTSLVQRSRDEAEAAGYQLFRMDCTNAYLAKIAEREGMQCIYKVKYSDLKDEKGENLFDELSHPHTQAKIFVDYFGPQG